MNKKTIEQFKKKLLAEKADLENQLAGIGRRTPGPGSSGTWEATSGDLDIDSADENEVADKLEELEENTGIVNQLDKQLEEVNAALERIDRGVYGICEKCDKPIEEDRLMANPSARTSIKHGH